MESEQTLIMMGQSLHQPPLPPHTTGGGGAVITHNTIVIRQTLLPVTVTDESLGLKHVSKFAF